MALTFAQPLRAMPSADIGNVTAETLFQDSSSNPIILPLAPASKLKNRMFTLRCWGRVQTGTTSNETIIVYFTTQSRTSNAVPASGNKIATSGAVSLATINDAFALEIKMTWNATANVLNGFFYGNVYTTAVAVTTFTTRQTSLDPTLDVTANPGQGFVVSSTMASGNAGNHAFLDGFELEV